MAGKFTFTDYNDVEHSIALPKDAVARAGSGGKHWVVIESGTNATLVAERLVEWFVEDVLGEAVQFPVTVNIRPMGKRSLTKYGHFTVEPAWSTREGNPVWEIGIVAEHLNRTPREIATTVFHEAIHVYNYSRNEKDTAKSGRHNRVFAEAAEQAGLIVEKHSKHGHVTTGMTDELWAKVEAMVPVEAFDLFATYKPKPAASSSKTKAYQCECATFKVRVPAKQSLEATCKTCGGDYELCE